MFVLFVVKRLFCFVFQCPFIIQSRLCADDCRFHLIGSMFDVTPMN